MMAIKTRFFGFSLSNRPWQTGFAFVVILVSCSKASTPSSDETAHDQKNQAVMAPASEAGTKVPNDHFQISRRLSISDLEEITHPTPGSLTTAELGRRTTPTEAVLPDGVQIQTRCGSNWCVDGLSIQGKALIAPALSAEEAQIYRDNGSSWLERILRVAWQDESVISVYMAKSEFSEGAHANNSFWCRSFDKRTGRSLSLGDVIPSKSAELLLSKARLLLGSNVAMDELGEDLGASEFKFDPKGFRFGREADYHGNRPEIILCAEGSYPRESDTIVELRVEAIPVGYLLR